MNASSRSWPSSRSNSQFRRAATICATSRSVKTMSPVSVDIPLVLFQRARVPLRQAELPRLQQAAHDLPRPRLRQGRHEVDLARRHAGAELVAREAQQLASQLVGRLRAGLEGYEPPYGLPR